MKIGDYVRTKQGKIGEISDLKVDYSSELILCEESSIPFSKHQIIKSSPNIIDLIEKNDLVIDNYENIYVVDYVFDNYVYTTTKQGNIIKTLCDYQIKSIVTKEQFESMEYKVGE